RQLLDEVLAEHPDNPLALRTRGQMAKTDGDLEEAERWLREAVRVAPNDSRALWALAECLGQLDKTAEAQEMRKRHDQVKDLEERLAELSSSKISTNPDSAELRTEMGVLHLALGNKEVAEGWLLSALSLQPDYGPGHAALAECYAQKGDAEKAAEHRE